MTRPWLLASIGGLCIAAVTIHGAAPVQSPVPIFRSDTTVISVNVSVQRGNTSVPGLATSDFTLLDNGVPQALTHVSVEDVPVDVTLIVDVSDSTRQILERIRQDTKRILELLRPVDRVRVLAIDSYVYEVVDMQPASGVALPPRTEGGGMSSIYDAIAVGLVGRLDPDRRRLVVVLTDAVDTMSVVSAAAVLAIARQSDSVLHLMLTESAYSGVAASAGSASVFAAPVGLSHPGRREIATLEEAALSTGGQLQAGEEQPCRDVQGGLRRFPTQLRSPVHTHGGISSRMAPAGRECQGAQVAQRTRAGQRACAQGILRRLRRLEPTSDAYSFGTLSALARC